MWNRVWWGRRWMCVLQRWCLQAMFSRRSKLQRRGPGWTHVKRALVFTAADSRWVWLVPCPPPTERWHLTPLPWVTGSLGACSDNRTEHEILDLAAPAFCVLGQFLREARTTTEEPETMFPERPRVESRWTVSARPSQAALPPETRGLWGKRSWAPQTSWSAGWTPAGHRSQHSMTQKQSPPEPCPRPYPDTVPCNQLVVVSC